MCLYNWIFLKLQKFKLLKLFNNMSDSDSSFLEQNCTFKKTQTKNYLIL